jgi:hypothetical protein
VAESTPIAETLALKVLQRIQSVRRSNGFSVDLKAERYTNKRENQPQDDTAVVFEGDDSVIDDRASGFMEYHKPFFVKYFALESEDSAVSIDRRCNFARADIEKAVMSDVFWDGYALNTYLRGAQRFEPGPAYGVVVQFDIHYRVREDDPYSQE